MPRHVFLAATAGAVGELNLARVVAQGLHERGHEVVFLAPQAVSFLFEGSPFRHQAVDPILPLPSHHLPRALQREKADSLVLVDVTSVFVTLETVWAADADFLVRLPLPVVALDVWDLPRTDLQWDFGTDALPISPRTLEIQRRLVPVPFAHPQGDRFRFDALPVLEPPPAAAREEMRRELGLGEADRLVLLLSSRWQTPEMQHWKHHQRLARHLPALALDALASLGPRVHVAHVGPQEFEGAGGLGGRYHWIAQLRPDRFQALMAAADALLTFNTSATSTLSALALGLPVVLAVNSRAGQTVEEVAAGLPGPLPGPVRSWLERVVPLHPFRVWPLGLHRLLTPVLADNPFAAAVRTVEVLEWDQLTGACRELLFEAAARQEARERQASYCDLVRRLPAGADVLLSQL
ncbi:MAG TPA: DUF6365 family protein [Vicinamibacteria bacterium]|nr:DUF6365 family protein [Vicinamibacteria bacterium]